MTEAFLLLPALLVAAFFTVVVFDFDAVVSFAPSSLGVLVELRVDRVVVVAAASVSTRLR